VEDAGFPDSIMEPMMFPPDASGKMMEIDKKRLQIP